MARTLGYFDPKAPAEDIVDCANEINEKLIQQELEAEGKFYVGSFGIDEPEKAAAIKDRVMRFMMGEDVDFSEPIE